MIKKDLKFLVLFAEGLEVFGNLKEFHYFKDSTNFKLIHIGQSIIKKKKNEAS